MRFSYVAACGGVPAVLFVALAFAAEGPEAKRPVPKITISKETTYITEPLRADGHPDYVAALNERAKQGVTPENNAAVLLLKAIGPGELENAAETYHQLGIDPLPADENYLVDEAEVIKKWKNDHPSDTDVGDYDQKLSDQFSEGITRPWSAEELPLVANWLEVNRRPLELAIEASQRPRYYWPNVTRANGLIEVFI